MTFSSQEFESFVPVYDMVPDKWDDARGFFVEILRKISTAINAREIGFFLDEELLSGKSFFPGTVIPGNNPGQFRQIFRKVIDFGALPNTATKSVAHGIKFDSNFTLIQMFASATDPVNLLAFPIPFVANPVANSIQIYMDATNVNITTQDDKSSYTRVFVVIEYMQEL